jgi:hypothetical protein
MSKEEIREGRNDPKQLKTGTEKWSPDTYETKYDLKSNCIVSITESE